VKIKELTDVPSVRDYLNRVGAQPRSLKAAVVKQVSGSYWKDLAIIKFTKGGDIDCSTLEHGPTDLERQMIKDALSSVTWPEIKKLSHIVDAPQMVKDADPKHVFEFRDTDGQIIMVQVRQEIKGERFYAPWTYWDDDQWRMCEPDGPLPLYNTDKIGDNTTVFIHEGAKAARHMQWLSDAGDREAKAALEAHPWGLELSGAVHVGWIGGALSPARTNWGVLMAAGVKRAYIVADNDEPGQKAVPAIAQQLRIPTFHVQFTQEFPASFDLADEFPKKMFSNGSGEKVYVGPTFRECLHPATWATDVVPPSKEGGRPGHTLRDSFRNMWAYVEEPTYSSALKCRRSCAMSKSSTRCLLALATLMTLRASLSKPIRVAALVFVIDPMLRGLRLRSVDPQPSTCTSPPMCEQFQGTQDLF
jgi:hypothetical protein